MKSWIVSKTFSETVVRSDRAMNRWIKMWNKIKKKFRSLNINAIATNERLSRLHIFFMISMLIFEIKRWKNKKMFEFKTFCQQINCQSSYRKLWIVRNQTLDHENNKQLIHQTMLFLSHSKKCSFKFLTQTDYWIRAKIFRNAKITIIVIFQVNAKSRQTEHVKTSKIRQSLC